MKPRLFKLFGLWHCGTQLGCGYVVFCGSGIGYTPLQAYDDWLARHYNAEARKLKAAA